MEQEKNRHIHQIQDIQDRVPHLAPYLLPQEKIIQIENIPITLPSELLSYEKALCMLCRVTDVKDLGKNGPPFASAASLEDAAIKALRLYEAVFGRDSLYMCDHLLEQFPELAKITLLYLASYQGVEFYTQREEEPGRIPHEIRSSDDPVAQALQKEKGIEWPYYGSIDSTPLFIRVLYRYCTEIPQGFKILEEEYTDRRGEKHILFDACVRALDWILTRMNQNKESFVESKAAFPSSLFFQGLQDSQDEFDSGGTYPLFHKDGSMANTKQGVVVTEVQAQVYDALLYGAEILQKIHLKFPSNISNAHDITPENVRIRAAHLKKEIMKLWVEDENTGYFAAGADRSEDGRLRPFKIKKAIPAFMLNTLLFDSENNSTQDSAAQDIIEKWLRVIFSPHMLAAGGLRSLSNDEHYFYPYAYHNGAVWPIITMEVDRGLRKHGYHFLAQELEKRICACCEQTHVYPEYVQGIPTHDIKISTRIVRAYSEKFGVKKREQPPQLYQGWTVSAYALIIFNEKTKKYKNVNKKHQLKNIELEIAKKLGLL